MFPKHTVTDTMIDKDMVCSSINISLGGGSFYKSGTCYITTIYCLASWLASHNWTLYQMSTSQWENIIFGLAIISFPVLGH